MESHESIREKSPLARLVEQRIEFLDPNEGSFLRLYVRENLDATTREILERSSFLVVAALSPEELKSDTVQRIVLSSQYIADQTRPDRLREYLPFRVALVMTRRALDGAMQERGFSWMWQGELQYGWAIDEDDVET